MTSPYQNTFLFDRALVAETPGVRQYIAYAVNPSIYEVVKGIYLPSSGTIAFYRMRKNGKGIDPKAIYEGPAQEGFVQAVLADAHKADSNPLLTCSFCLMEEYGIYRAKGLDEAPKHPVEIEFIQPPSIVTFRFVSHATEMIDNLYAANYEVLFDNNLQFPVEVLTADDPALLEDVSYNDKEVIVGGVPMEITNERIYLWICLLKRGTLERDVFAREMQPGS